MNFPLSLLFKRCITTDHDYGCNNADSTYEFSRESGMAFVGFLGESISSPMHRRARRGQGAYGVKVFDFARPQGQVVVPDHEAQIDPDLDGVLSDAPSYSNKSVAVFVLDIRTHKIPWKKGSAACLPDYDGDFLGEQQWLWFETAIRRSRAAVNVVVNGLQVHANIFPNANVAEAWGKFPVAQQRLYDAVLQEGVEAPILISGDVHMTQFMRKDCTPRGTPGDSPRSLVEFTTSGMTHSWGTLSSPLRGGIESKPSWLQYYHSFVAQAFMTLHHHLCPRTDLMKADKSAITSGVLDNGAVKGLQYSLAKNFGGEYPFDAPSMDCMDDIGWHGLHG